MRLNSIRFQAAVPQFTVPDLVRTAEYYRDVFDFRGKPWLLRRVAAVI
jgi:hypothetical protein